MNQSGAVVNTAPLWFPDHGEIIASQLSRDAAVTGRFGHMRSRQRRESGETGTEQA